MGMPLLLQEIFCCVIWKSFKKQCGGTFGQIVIWFLPGVLFFSRSQKGVRMNNKMLLTPLWRKLREMASSCSFKIGIELFFKNCLLSIGHLGLSSGSAPLSLSLSLSQNAASSSITEDPFHSFTDPSQTQPQDPIFPSKTMLVPQVILLQDPEMLTFRRRRSHPVGTVLQYEAVSGRSFEDHRGVDPRGDALDVDRRRLASRHRRSIRGCARWHSNLVLEWGWQAVPCRQEVQSACSVEPVWVTDSAVHNSGQSC